MIIIAIDGPAGSGKTTIATGLAKRLGLAKVDTGAIYRAAAFLAQRLRVDFEDEDALAELAARMRTSLRVDGETRKYLLDGEDVTEKIRRPEVSAAASKLSAWPKVRAMLLDLQRELALNSGTKGAVLEGRDIGTVVFPDADVKLFLTASAEERARRRFQELKGKGLDVEWEQVAADQAARDEQDSSRPVAPLAPAKDATVFDSTGMEVEEVLDGLEKLVKGRIQEM